MRYDETRTFIVGQQRQDACKAMATYLESYKWHLCYTATFKYPATHARTAIDRVRKALLPESDGRLFVAAEPHYLGNWHCHGLLWKDEDDDATRYYAADNLDRLGWNVVSSCRSSGAVSRYCAKYIAKSLADWDLTGNWKQE